MKEGTKGEREGEGPTLLGMEGEELKEHMQHKDEKKDEEP